MWTCWGSRPIGPARSRRAVGGAGLVLPAALAVAALAIAAGPTAGADSVRVVREIRIGEGGIEIDGAVRTDRGTSRRRDRVGARRAQDSEGRTVRIEDGPADGDTARRGSRVRVLGPVVSVDDRDAGIVRVCADAEVAPGERVDGDVVAVFGSVTVDGEVTGDAVAVFGSMRLGPEARVGGDAVAVGGVLQQDPGARVSGEIVSVGFLPVSFGIPTIRVLIVTLLGGLLLTLFVGWLLHLVMPLRMLRVAVTCSRRTAGSLLLGLVAPPLVFVAGILLFITFIGIPLAIVLPFLYVLTLWGGQIAATHVLGSSLLRRPLGEGGFLLPLFAGMLFVAGFFVLGALLGGPPGLVRSIALFFSLLGLLLIFALSTIGSGAFLLSRFGSRPEDVRWAPAGGALGGAAPSPGTAQPPPAL